METPSDAPPLPDVADSTADRIAPQPPSPIAEHPLGSSPPAIAVNPLSHTDDESHFPGHENGYISSASSAQQSSNDILGRDLDEEELAHLNSAVSSRSSISSIPASILIHSIDESKPSIASGADNNTFTHSWVDNGNTGHGKTEAFIKSVHTLRQREAAFRKPSSVRAMQMHTEDEEEDEFLTPPRRRSHRSSDISMRSAGSSLKRSPYYTPSGSGSKPKVKKEFPLVLLHCNLLAPSIPVPPGIGTPSQKTLREVLPAQYWRRWRLLEEKVGSGVLRDRGVLISHPQDMYDLLEERLLESLELQRPRLDKGHFLGQEETDSEREGSYKDESATDDEQGEQCPDCGGRVIRGSHARKKWEIKVFAANGLMRAGAWAAAWKEMEKVDVEVGLWLPSDVRRDLEKRLLEDEESSPRHTTQLALEDVPDNSLAHPKEIPSSYGEQIHIPPQESILTGQEPPPRKRSDHATPIYDRNLAHEVDLQTLLINYIRVLASDRRNVAISILSIVVVLLAIGGKNQVPSSDVRPFPSEPFDVEPGAPVTMPPSFTSASEIPVCSMIPSGPTIEVSMSSSAEATESEILMTAESSIELTTASEISANSVPLSTPTVEVSMSPSAEATKSEVSLVAESSVESSTASEVPASSMSFNTPTVEASVTSSAEEDESDMSTASETVPESTSALEILASEPSVEASVFTSAEATETDMTATVETSVESTQAFIAEELPLSAYQPPTSAKEPDNSIEPTFETGEVEEGITFEEEDVERMES